MSNWRISPRFRVSDWQAIRFCSDDDWNKAIEIVEDRIRGRFVTFIDQVVGIPFAGFVVVALDCLLLETIYGFQSGRSSRDMRAAYRELLPKVGPFDVQTANSFYEDVRCGIVHDTETRNKWLIEQTEPNGKVLEIDSSGNRVLNRTEFHSCIKKLLKDWLESLRKGDVGLRECMRCRMNEIIVRHT